MPIELLDPSRDDRTDEALIAAVNDGDTAAFEILYYRHREWVVNLAFRFTADRDLALDVLQEAFLYLLRKFPGFTLTCRLRSFLYPAVRHLGLTARRKAERCQSAGTDPAELGLEAPPSAACESLGDLAVALSNLSEDHREVLLLRFVHGLSMNEIADALGVPAGTVKSRLHNGLAHLRADPGAREYFEP